MGFKAGLSRVVDVFRRNRVPGMVIRSPLVHAAAAGLATYEVIPTEKLVTLASTISRLDVKTAGIYLAAALITSVISAGVYALSRSIRSILNFREIRASRRLSDNLTQVRSELSGAQRQAAENNTRADNLQAFRDRAEPLLRQLSAEEIQVLQQRAAAPAAPVATPPVAPAPAAPAAAPVVTPVATPPAATPPAAPPAKPIAPPPLPAAPAAAPDVLPAMPPVPITPRKPVAVVEAGGDTGAETTVLGREEMPDLSGALAEASGEAAAALPAAPAVPAAALAHAVVAPTPLAVTPAGALPGTPPQPLPAFHMESWVPPVPAGGTAVVDPQVTLAYSQLFESLTDPSSRKGLEYLYKSLPPEIILGLQRRDPAILAQLQSMQGLPSDVDSLLLEIF